MGKMNLWCCQASGFLWERGDGGYQGAQRELLEHCSVPWSECSLNGTLLCDNSKFSCAFIFYVSTYIIYIPFNNKKVRFKN